MSPEPLNPTLKTLDRIATSLNMSVLELLGFELDDARRALKKSGVSYDDLATALVKRNEADRRVARHTLAESPAAYLQYDLAPASASASASKKYSAGSRAPSTLPM